jgi:hypothetical protein
MARTPEELAEAVRQRRLRDREDGRLPANFVTPAMLVALSRIVASSLPLPRRRKGAA